MNASSKNRNPYK